MIEECEEKYRELEQQLVQTDIALGAAHIALDESNQLLSESYPREMQLRADIKTLVDVLETAEAAMSTCQDHRYSDGSLHHQDYNTVLIGRAISKTHQVLGAFRNLETLSPPSSASSITLSDAEELIASAYQHGHHDTVESRYGVPSEVAGEIITEFMGKAK